MASAREISDYGRIEDFIALANEGGRVDLAIELKKQLVTQKVPQGVTEDMKDEIDMYLLTADYIFKVGKDMKIVSKVYVFGSSEEPPDVIHVNSHIANARLKMDYQRLKDAKITFEEKYF
jgi:hypothetical protein